MRNERDLNGLITRSINKKGFAHKISDSVSLKSSQSNKLPFDIFGIYNGKPVYIESKFLKEPKAFNFSRLEEHQIKSLIKCKKLCPDASCLLLIGVVFGRGDIRVFYFDDPEYLYDRKLHRQSILKKEFESMTNYVSVKKDLIDLSFI